MSNIVVGSDNASDDVVLIPVESGNAKFSMQVYQDLYHQITKKTEEKQVEYSSAIKIELDDIKQLDLKIKQTIEQWDVLVINCSYTIFSDRNQKEVYSSIERFCMYNEGASSCTENVVIRYNFSLRASQTKNPQSYTIQINLSNRVALRKKIIEESPIKIPPVVISMLSSKTAEIKVGFVDYVCARSIMSAFDEWIKSLDESAESGFIKKLKEQSFLIKPVFEILTLAFLFYLIYLKIPIYVSEDSPSPQLIAYFLFFIVVAVFSLYKFSGFMGAFVGGAIGSVSEVSYIKLTKGDAKYIDRLLSSNKHEKVKAILGSVVNILVSVAVKYFSTRI